MAKDDQFDEGTLEARLDGRLLIAMPSMADERFARSVVYVCAHSDEGAMGLIINQPADHIDFSDLLTQLEIMPAEDVRPSIAGGHSLAIHFGGPVETGRGFVLHSSDYYSADSTMTIDDEVSLTATVDILRAIAAGKGPKRALLALGYAGWAPGQLEYEIRANGWLHCDADPELVFDSDDARKYELALSRLGIDPTHLVGEAGHA